MAWENEQLYNYGLIYVHKWVLEPSWHPLLLLEKKIRFLVVCNSLCLTISLTTILLLIACLSQKGSLLLYLQEGLQTICSKIMVGDKVKQMILELMKLIHFQQQSVGLRQPQKAFCMYNNCIIMKFLVFSSNLQSHCYKRKRLFQERRAKHQYALQRTKI